MPPLVECISPIMPPLAPGCQRTTPDTFGKEKGRFPYEYFRKPALFGLLRKAFWCREGESNPHGVTTAGF